MSSLNRLFELVDQQPAVSEPQHPIPIDNTSVLDFRFDKVSFTYPGHHKPALQDVSFDFPQGHKLAVVGMSGSGKSTLVNLLLRFRDPQQGSITLNKQPLASYQSEILREQIAVVPQQTHLFNQPIKDNLLLADENASQEELERVCKLAMIHDTLLALPDGYETWVGETGVRLSGGQARRVAIARALLKKARLLILDEPTEGLDPENASQLMHNIFWECGQQNKSLLVISHQHLQLGDFDEVLEVTAVASTHKPAVPANNPVSHYHD